MHGFAHGFVAPKRKAHVADAAADEHARKFGLDAPRRVEIGQRVVVVLFDARGDGEDIGVKDDVLGQEAHLVGQDVISAVGDGYPVIGRFRLAVLVEGHDNDRRAVAPGQSRLADEFRLAFLQADRIDHALALDALQSGLDDAPFGGIDHDRHAGDIRFSGQQIEKADHRRLGVEHALVHVDIDHLRAVLHLLAGHFQRGGIVAIEDEPGETLGTGDIGALADVDEVRVRADDQWLQPTQPGVGRHGRNRARRQVTDGFGEGANVGRGRATAAADDVHHPFGRIFAQYSGHVFRRVVVAAELVGQSRVGINAGIGVHHLRQGIGVVAKGLGPQRAVQPHDERPGVHDRVVDGFGRLARQVPAAGVDNGAGDHQRPFDARFIEVAQDAGDGRLGVECVENGLDEQDVGPAVHQAACRLGVGIGQFVEGDVSITGVVDVGRDRGRLVGRAQRPGHESRPGRVAAFHLVAGLAGQLGRGHVHFVGQVLQTIVGLRNPVGVKRVGLDQIGSGLEIGQMDGANHIRACQHQQVIVALQVLRPAGEPLAPEVGFR